VDPEATHPGSAIQAGTPAPVRAVLVAGPPGLAQKLGLFDITMLVMGSVIGVGIFVIPTKVASLVPSPELILGAWVVGGLSTLAGSLVYAELARRRPYVGGQYAFLREAYHPGVAFVYGWSLLWIIQSGGTAAVAVIFARYSLKLLGLLGGWLAKDEILTALAGAPAAEPVIAAAAIALIAAVNCAGVRSGSTAQNIFMSLKILAIGTLVLCGLLVADGLWSLTGPAAVPADLPAPGRVARPADGGAWALGFAAALVQVLFSYGGSHTTTFMAAEVREPRRNLPRGLVLGILGVIALYLGVNFACLRVLGVDQLAVTKEPASAVMQRAWGAAGAALLSAGIAVSALGFLSQAILTSPRVYYAMARDGLFFRAVAHVHPRTRVPVVAILLQGAFAMVIAVSGTFEQIVKYVMSVELVFLSLTALGLFVIRRHDARDPDTANLAGWGHPWTTLLFAAVNMTLVAGMFWDEPWNSGVGIAIALAGVPVYFYWHRANRNLSRWIVP
jgi:APA family basic amino acid/polyamine antiporter